MTKWGNTETIAFSDGFCFFGKNHGLDTRDPSFKENRVSEDGDKKEGFETILR